MIVVAILLNTLLIPGLGTLVVRRVGSGFAQLGLWLLAVLFLAAGTESSIGLGALILLATWVWSLVSVANAYRNPHYA